MGKLLERWGSCLRDGKLLETIFAGEFRTHTQRDGSCWRLCFAEEFRPHTQRDGKLLETMLSWRVSTSHSEGWEVARDYALLESWVLVERVLKTAPSAAVFCHLITGTETYAVNL